MLVARISRKCDENAFRRFCDENTIGRFTTGKYQLMTLDGSPKIVFSETLLTSLIPLFGIKMSLFEDFDSLKKKVSRVSARNGVTCLLFEDFDSLKKNVSHVSARNVSHMSARNHGVC